MRKDGTETRVFTGEFERELHIDQYALDQEWLGQPMLYQRYAEKVAVARRDLDVMKDEIAEFEARVDQEVRDAAGDEKITEKAITQKIALNPRLKEKKRALLDAKYELDRLSGMLTSLDHRRRALENLVDLHGQSYFATPREPKGGENMERKAVSGKANEKIKERRRQRDEDDD